MPIRAIILIAFLVLSLPVCFIRPFYGILLWTILAFLNPQQYTWDAQAFPWAVVVAVPTLLGFVINTRDWRRLGSLETSLIALLWIWFTITSAVSTSTPLFAHHAADTWSQWSYVSKVLLMTLATAALTNSFERLRTFVLVLAGCFAIFVLKGLPFIVMSGGVHRLYGPERSMIADNNDFGLALTMTLPLFLCLAQTEPQRGTRRLCGFLFVATIPAIFCTYSRGALVGLTALMGLMLVRMKQRLLLIPVMAFAVLIAILLAPPAWKERMDPTRKDAVDSSARARLNAWSYSWNLASEYPITGGGFDTFTPELFARYAPNGGDIHGPHSVYFEILAEHGFVGLFLYLALVCSSFLSTYRLLKAARAFGDPVIAQYALMLRFSLVGFLACGVFLGRAYFDYFFAIVACIVSLKNAASDRWAVESADQIEELEEEPELLPEGPAFGKA